MTRLAELLTRPVAVPRQRGPQTSHVLQVQHQIAAHQRAVTPLKTFAEEPRFRRTWL